MPSAAAMPPRADTTLSAGSEPSSHGSEANVPPRTIQEDTMRAVRGSRTIAIEAVTEPAREPIP